MNDQRSLTPEDTLRIRALDIGDGHAVRRAFRSTALLGRTLRLHYGDLVPYERLCLDWFLSDGRAETRVAERHGSIVGALLPCFDPAAHAAWARRAEARWKRHSLARIACGRADVAARRFCLRRLSDARHAPRPEIRPAGSPFARVIVDARALRTGVGRSLVARMDDLTTRRGFDDWWSEIDVATGDHLRALERAGLPVVRTIPNRALTSILGTPVYRASVVRTPPEPLTRRVGRP